MLLPLKRLALGIILILAASGVLLLSDRDHREASAREGGRKVRVAIFQQASQPIIDDGTRGMADALAANGFAERKNLEIRRYNAQGDMATANSIASELVDGGFDLILTATTPSMQAVARANQNKRRTHVFGLVSDPPGAGVGISRENPLEHPPYMAGLGTMQPVADSFQMARQMFPGLKTVGVAWNPAESNSQATTKLARQVGQQMGITLLEATVDNSSGVGEAASSLVSRGAQALWIGGDVTVNVALDAVLAAARKGRVPVFTVIPGDAERGALFDVGADYYEIGRVTGTLGALILKGLDPATVPVKNLIPRKVVVNQQALRDLKDPWQLPEAMVASADEVIDASGHAEKRPLKEIDVVAALGLRVPVTKKWAVSVVEYVNVQDIEDAERGLRDGLKAAALVPDRDYTLTVKNAQGDMPALNTIVDGAVTAGADMIVPMSTPALQAAMKGADGRPVVFTYVADPATAGAGRSDTDHAANVCGVYTSAPYEEMAATLHEVLPHARRVGTLFVPTEVNTVFHKDQTTKAMRKYGIETVAVPASTPAEVSDAAAALCSRDLDAVCQIGGNMLAASFTSIAQAAYRVRMPLFAYLSSQAEQGAAIVVARDYYDAGRETGLLAARVMRGADPAKIPFEPVRKSRLILNLEGARRTGLTIPPALLKRADQVLQK